MANNIIITQNLIDDINHELAARDEDFTVELSIAKKPHGDEYGILINTGTNASPVLHLTDDVITPTNVAHLVDEIIELYERTCNMNIDMNKYIQTKYITENVKPRFVRQQFKNQLEATNTYYVPWNDLLVIFYIPVKENATINGVININKQILDATGIDENNLFEMAKNNLEKVVNIEPLMDVLERMMGSAVPLPDKNSEPKIHIASNFNPTTKNNTESFGATVILTDKFAEHVNTFFGGEAVILPSSVHEVLIIDGKSMENSKELVQMITEINTNELVEKDILEYHPYYFYNGTVHVQPDDATLCKISSDEDACLDLYENPKV